jgi:hypothetical protein
MRHGGCVVLIALLGFSPLAAGERHNGFSGTWRMDPARSESAHQGVPIESSMLVIRLKDTGLTMETTRSEGGKPAAFHETLNLRLDGLEMTSIGDGGITVTAKARWDGNKLVVETVRSIEGSTVTTLYVHALSANKREMTIDKTLSVQHGYQGRSASNTGHGTDVFVRVAK